MSLKAMPAGDVCPTQGSGITSHLQKDPTIFADNLSNPGFQHRSALYLHASYQTEQSFLSQTLRYLCLGLLT